MMDALRLVAVLGAILWMIPVIWPGAEGGSAEPVPMSRALFYIFGVWAGLILLAAFLALNLRGQRSRPESEASEAEPRA